MTLRNLGTNSLNSSLMSMVSKRMRKILYITNSRTLHSYISAMTDTHKIESVEDLIGGLAQCYPLRFILVGIDIYFKV